MSGVKSLVGAWYFGKSNENAFAKDEVCINGRFAYAVKRKPLKAGHVKTEAYIDSERRLDGRFCAKGFQEAVSTNDVPTAQLQSLRAPLSVISYRKWNFRVVDVYMVFF